LVTNSGSKKVKRFQLISSSSKAAIKAQSQMKTWKKCKPNATSKLAR